MFIKPKSLLQSYPFYIFGIALLLLVVIWIRSESLSRSYMKLVENDIRVRGRLIHSLLHEKIAKADWAGLAAACQWLGTGINTRISIIAADGKVMVDSERDPSKMENHQGRPELIEAMAGKPGVDMRHSTTLEQNMLYLAMPVDHVVPPRYILRVATSVDAVTGVLALARRDILLAGAVTALVAALLSLFIIHMVSLPIEDIRQSAQRLAAGDLDTRIPVPPRGDIRELAEAINNMAEQLKTRLYQQQQGKKERDAILASLVEGVVAMNNELEIIWMNDVAARMLGVRPDARGAHLYEVQRHAGIAEFAEHIVAAKQPDQMDIVITSGNEQETNLRLSGSLLHGPDNEYIGVLIVISDFTEVRRLENFRRDFVANVSHEIRTPLTAIRGAVETLQDARTGDPAFAERLMDMIIRHCDRLNALNADILALATLEREGARDEFVFEPVASTDIVNVCVNLCRTKAAQKHITLKTAAGESVNIECDRQLLEQALINLIDNAIKYSNDDSIIDIAVERVSDEQLCFSVRDYGIGIPEKHLPRLFERFYRVDKARSRKLGGTGLGLSIVKHVMQLHKGTVDVRSKVGEGSVFGVVATGE